jgi:hypothetical protein
MTISSNCGFFFVRERELIASYDTPMGARIESLGPRSPKLSTS